MNVDATHLISLFENATEGIILTNGQGEIVLVNPAAQRMFDYKENELIGRPIEVLLPERVKPHHQHLREGFYKQKQNNNIQKIKANKKNKVKKRTMILKEALQKLEESQQELSAALDKERQLNEIKSRFVSMASHEFRTPLSTILSSATLIGKYPTTEENEKRQRHIRKINDSVSHMNG